MKTISAHADKNRFRTEIAMSFLNPTILKSLSAIEEGLYFFNALKSFFRC